MPLQNWQQYDKTLNGRKLFHEFHYFFFVRKYIINKIKLTFMELSNGLRVSTCEHNINYSIFYNYKNTIVL